MTVPWKSIAVMGLVTISSLSKASDEKLSLNDCHLEGITQLVQCGKLEVPENYTNKTGDTISINFAVLPAIDNSQKNEPLMFLAGGPGQAAVSLAGGLYKAFNEVRKTRDLILVDQRGTGESNPLQCENAEQLDPYTNLPSDFSVEEIKQCLTQLEGDLSQYNSENAIRDFDAVRAALGHEKIAIYGGSYGTRAGLVYMRMFPDSLTSVILDSVGPIEVPIGLFGKSAERSFNMLLENCRAEESCQNAYPNLAQEFEQVKAELAKKPITVSLPHPRLGTPMSMKVDEQKFVSTIFSQLYSVDLRSLVPLIIHQASLGNYAPLAGLTAAGDVGEGMFLGLTFNILCNEDVPRVTDAMWQDDASNTFNGSISQYGLKLACPVWPTYQVSTDFTLPVDADIPTLIISGDLDPVTPPSNAEYSDRTLPNSKHIIMPNSSHTPGVQPCAMGMISEFLTTQNPNDLDDSCLTDIPAESFMTSLNGGV
ncbi:alpha/beta hydrolase [Thalassotalea sp. 1_MG-2023]|uniref:alpha/beta hydrolase n=1 Tax=Thalassotalea sp. 1_MG-2023 TaxID=3062680 RepID=UPI0026E17752|nr:alpha/beta hydrolase [Thalassotalea sp. 1_MG-2023]MDO6426325.1 alpha/beta hydrolase [Thalassotalea sp. 1_MG-2023]